MCGVMLQELDAKVKCLTSRVDEKSSEAAMLRQQLDEHISARLSGVDDSAAANDAHAAKLARENYALRTEVPYIGAILLFFIFLVHVSKQSISFFNCHMHQCVYMSFAQMNQLRFELIRCKETTQELATKANHRVSSRAAVLHVFTSAVDTIVQSCGDDVVCVLSPNFKLCICSSERCSTT